MNNRIALAAGGLVAMLAAWSLMSTPAAPPPEPPAKTVEAPKVEQKKPTVTKSADGTLQLRSPDGSVRPVKLTKLDAPPAFARKAAGKAPAATEQESAKIEAETTALLDQLDDVVNNFEELDQLGDAEWKQAESIRDAVTAQVEKLHKQLQTGQISYGMAMVRSAQLQQSAAADFKRLAGPKNEGLVDDLIEPPKVDLTPDEREFNWEADPRGWDALLEQEQ